MVHQIKKKLVNLKNVLLKDKVLLQTHIKQHCKLKENSFSIQQNVNLQHIYIYKNVNVEGLSILEDEYNLKNGSEVNFNQYIIKFQSETNTAISFMMIHQS